MNPVERKNQNKNRNSISVPERKISNPHQLRPVTPLKSTSKSTLSDNNFYNKRHAPTSNPSGLTKVEQEKVKMARLTAHNIAKRQAEQDSKAEAQKRYHTAWQNYYQKYYENYYMAALQEQYKKLAEERRQLALQKDKNLKTFADRKEREASLGAKKSKLESKLKKDLINKIKQEASKVKAKRWFWPVVSALIVCLLFIAIQYNGLITAQIASFISPGNSSNSSVIVSPDQDQTVTNSPRIIIPKININAPVTYGLTDLSESSSQKALESGPIHYPIVNANSLPGENGNTVILGHSSADFFAGGNYKFIFVQLNKLQSGDIFYLDYAKKRFIYKVRELKIISPNQIDALNLGQDKPYATLITCDPPGTTINRLLVIAEQISPKPEEGHVYQASDSKITNQSITGRPATLLEKIFGK